MPKERPAWISETAYKCPAMPVNRLRGSGGPSRAGGAAGHSGYDVYLLGSLDTQITTNYKPLPKLRNKNMSSWA